MGYWLRNDMGLLNFMSKFSKKEEAPEERIRVETVEVRPTFNQPKKEIHELPKIDPNSVKARLDRMYREEHDLDSAPDTRLRTVKERLEELRLNPKPVQAPLNSLREQAPVIERKEPSQDQLVQARIDKAIKRLEAVKQKMEKTDSYLSLFYDLKAAEKEFLDSIEEANAQGVDLPETFQAKVELTKSRIKSRPQA